MSGAYRRRNGGKWDEPYKLTYREYMHYQAEKDTSTHSVKSALARSDLFEQVDPGWKTAIIAHYGAVANAEYQASIGEARMARFGKATAWRNMAVFGALDEVRHGQLQLFTFTFETGFTNLQFLGMAADAMDVGDVEFGAMISSIQTDEARHAQQGEPTLKVLVENGKMDEAQRLVDVMFWRSWRVFNLLTGLSMDYYTPLEHRSMSFKEFM